MMLLLVVADGGSMSLCNYTPSFEMAGLFREGVVASLEKGFILLWLFSHPTSTAQFESSFIHLFVSYSTQFTVGHRIAPTNNAINLGQTFRRQMKSMLVNKPYGVIPELHFASIKQSDFA